MGATALSDEEIILLIKNRHIAGYQIEKAVDNPERGVGIRRKILGSDLDAPKVLEGLPYRNYDYSLVTYRMLLVIYGLFNDSCFKGYGSLL